MASLIVSLHDIVDNYIRKSKDREKAGKIGSEVLLRSKEVAKKYLFDGEDACMFHVSQIYPMVSRELVRWNKIVAKRMKPRSSLSNPWGIRFSRNMPQEVFDLLKLTLLKGHYGTVSKKTSCVETLELTAVNSAREWIMHVGSKTSSEITINGSSLNVRALALARLEKDKMEEELKKAEHLSHKDPERAMELLSAIVKRDVDENNEDDVRIKEQAILDLGSLLAKNGRAAELEGLVKFIQPFMAHLSKAKAAKMVRELLDLFLDMEVSTGTEVDLCLECIEWAKSEKRVFLRQALESRLVGLYYGVKEYSKALSLGSKLLKELKKLDDKMLLVEVQLLESKIYHSLKNIPKSRAALTSARTTANAIYCPPKLQAALDMQSGILHAEEKDFKTAYSYFYEAFEGYDSLENAKAPAALKYMLLCKIMLNSPEDVQSIISGKLGLKYSGPSLQAMKKIADASHQRSLLEFKKILATYQEELQGDPIIQNHLDTLYDNLLEQNLCRIVEPFSKVEVDHVSHLIKLDKNIVEKKLSLMILDKKLHGILDQGAGVLTIFDHSPVDKTYENSLEIIHSMSKVMDALYHKSKKLS